MSYRIWHLVSNRWYSAISEYALRSVISLNRVGCENIISPLDDSPLHQKAIEAGVDVDPIDSFSPGIKTLRWLYRGIDRFNPDIIITYGGPETFLLRLLPKKERVYIRFRGQNEDVTKPKSSAFGHSHIDGLLTPAKIVANRYAGLKKPIFTVPLGLDTNRFHADHAFQNQKRPTLRIIGRLDPVKGHVAFLKLFSKMLSKWDYSHPRPFLEIIGEPANVSSNDLRVVAASIGLVENRDYKLIDSRVSDIESLIASTHLGVIPSVGSEVICRVAEEFLLTGTPIAVNDVGSLTECLFDHGAGICYKANGDALQLVHVLSARLVEAFEEPLELRQKRAAKAQSLYSYEAMGKALFEMLEKLC